jgi:transposase
LLQQYKYQPRLEKRFEQLKTVYVVAPVWLKSVTRIEGLLTVFFLTLLVEALIERELRRAMQAAQIRSLPLYPEARACDAPTADRIFALFATVQRHELWDGDRLVQTFPPELTDLQRQVLELLGLPADAYGQR